MSLSGTKCLFYYNYTGSQEKLVKALEGFHKKQQLHSILKETQECDPAEEINPSPTPTPSGDWFLEWFGLTCLPHSESLDLSVFTLVL